MQSKGEKLDLENLHERHSGLTASLGGCFYEAASVCLARHHTSPVKMEVVNSDDSTMHDVNFTMPKDGTLNAWANKIDTTEAGAYGVSLAAVEVKEHMVAFRRAETLTGADWYIAPPDTVPGDLEKYYRLEVSGVDSGDRNAIDARLRQKIAQAKRGSSNLPAFASVVGFKDKVVLMQRVDDSQ